VVYAFGLDTLLAAWLASRNLDRRQKIIYEVGDIREILLGDGVVSRLLRWLERYLLRYVALLVVTSEAYIIGYFQGIQKVANLRYQVIENKLDAEDLPSIQDRKALLPRDRENQLRIGYFGLIRCRQSWMVLREAVKRGRGKIRVQIRGLVMLTEQEKEEIQNTEFVEYGGPYISPDDLPMMYRQVDMVWVATSISQSHLQWARVNRFYEACYFGLPMIAQEGTQDGQVVDKLGLGTLIDLLDVDRAVDQILRINEAKLVEWQKHSAEVPEYIYVYTDEHERLLKAIQ
jgi:succinoglycan biosynthesis protein ExoL